MNNLISDIEQLSIKYPFVNLIHYGFKTNWQDIMYEVKRKNRPNGTIFHSLVAGAGFEPTTSGL